MDEEFDILTVKILACEASAEEQARLEQLLAQNPELRREFADLKAAWDSVREIGPLARAMEAPPSPIPSARLVGLQAAVKKKFGSASGEDSVALVGELGREAQTAGKRTEHGGGDDDRFDSVTNSPFAIVRKWFGGKIGLAPFGGAAVLLILAALGVLLVKRPATAPGAAGETEVVAY